MSEDTSNNREVRIWLDGAFDLMHFGHMNAFRQGRLLGTKLIVGVNSDASITQCKGAPLFNDHERLTCVRECKWVDEVVENVPYVMNEQYLSHIIEKYNIDYIVHGDDPCIVDGKDVYQTAKDIGKYKSIPRTEGISTTDIVDRLLSRTTTTTTTTTTLSASLNGTATTNSNTDITQKKRKLSFSTPDYLHNLYEKPSKFLVTSNVIRNFSTNIKPPHEQSKVVYVPGVWDLLHSGHIHLLYEAKKRGDYLIVGIYSDHIAHDLYGAPFPILNVQERMLSLLGCKVVDDVVVDAPYCITKDMINTLKIHQVVYVDEYNNHSRNGKDKKNDSLLMNDKFNKMGTIDPFEIPKQLNIYSKLDVPTQNNLTAWDILDKVNDRREILTAKIDKKKVLEKNFYIQKYALPVSVSDLASCPV